jgi:hypothetical protein
MLGPPRDYKHEYNMASKLQGAFTVLVKWQMYKALISSKGYSEKHKFPFYIGSLKSFPFLKFLLFICAYNVWAISPPFSPPPPLPPYLAETILPLSLILWKREYKQ